MRCPCTYDPSSFHPAAQHTVNSFSPSATILRPPTLSADIPAGRTLFSASGGYHCASPRKLGSEKLKGKKKKNLIPNAPKVKCTNTGVNFDIC